MPRPFDIFALPTERIHHLLIVCVAEVPADLAAFGVRCPATIEADHSDHWQVMANSRIHLHSVHAEGPITMQDQHLLVWLRGLGPQAERHPHTHGPENPGIQAMPWDIGGDRLSAVIQDFLAIDHENGVAIQEVSDLFTKTQWMNRDLVRVQEGLQARLAFQILLAQGRNPRCLFTRVELALDQVEHLPEHRFRIAHNPHIHWASLANFRRIRVHLEDFGIRIKARRLAMGDHIIEPRAQEEHDIAILEGHIAGSEERPGMIVRNHTTALRGGQEWNTRGVDKLLELFTGIRPQDTATRDNQRAIGP